MFVAVMKPTVGGGCRVKISVLTFGGESAERPQELGESQVVLASHSLRFFTAQDGHHRDKRVLDELLHRLKTLGHVGTSV